MKKEVIYIDVEDDITAIIEKLKASKAKVVAMVPPKRSTVLSSAVNTKLLKRAAEDSGKRLVIVTNDSALIAISGGLGLHVAKNLQSKPYLPEAPDTPIDEDNVIEGDLSDLDPEAAVGELAGAAAAGAVVGAAAKKNMKKESSKKKENGKKSKDKTKKGFKIPNFERFRLKLILGVIGAVLIAVFWWWAAFIAPEADVNIVAQTSQLDTAIDYTVDVNAESSDIEAQVLKGEVKELKKTVTEEFTATGEDNVGAKATGTITVQNCNSSDPVTITAGTIFTSSSDLSFRTDSEISVPGGSFDFSGCTSAGTQDVSVTASESGDSYNLAPTGYTTTVIGITGVGGQMSGGTTVIKKVVSQEDFDKAKADFATRDYTAERQEMAELFGDGAVGLEDTFEYEVGKVTSSPEVGQEAEKAIMSAEIVFTQIGVAESDLSELLRESQEPRVDLNTQSIYDNGLNDASQELVKEGSGQYDFRLRTVGIVGPNIDTNALAEEIAGKRFSEAKGIVDAIPGVVSSEINLSPFWVNKVPSPEKTTINVEISENSLQ